DGNVGPNVQVWKVAPPPQSERHVTVLRGDATCDYRLGIADETARHLGVEICLGSGNNDVRGVVNDGPPKRIIGESGSIEPKLQPMLWRHDHYSFTVGSRCSPWRGERISNLPSTGKAVS